MTPEEHKEIHIQLHKSLDQLLADYITHVKDSSIDDSIYTLLKWSYEQTLNPSE